MSELLWLTKAETNLWFVKLLSPHNVKPTTNQNNTGFIKYPNRLKTSGMQFQDVSGATLTDSADNPLMNQLRTLKQKAIDVDRLHHDFWIANPACIDVEAFNAKAITYFLNPTHKSDFRSGGQKKVLEVIKLFISKSTRVLGKMLILLIRFTTC